MSSQSSHSTLAEIDVKFKKKSNMNLHIPQITVFTLQTAAKYGKFLIVRIAKRNNNNCFDNLLSYCHIIRDREHEGIIPNLQLV